MNGGRRRRRVLVVVVVVQTGGYRVLKPLQMGGGRIFLSHIFSFFSFSFLSFLWRCFFGAQKVFVMSSRYGHIRPPQHNNNNNKAQMAPLSLISYRPCRSMRQSEKVPLGYYYPVYAHLLGVGCGSLIRTLFMIPGPGFRKKSD